MNRKLKKNKNERISGTLVRRSIGYSDKKGLDQGQMLSKWSDGEIFLYAFKNDKSNGIYINIL